MGGFSNPVTNAAGQLVRNVMKSINYVAGLTGWQISKNGDAEFNLGNFRGSITVTGPNGAKIVINAGAGYPNLNFYSPDGTNFAGMAITGGTSGADLITTSGKFTPADGVQRSFRYWMDGTDSDFTTMVMKAVNQSPFGGIVTITPTSLLLGYRNHDAGIYDYLQFDTGGKIAAVSRNGFFANGKPMCTSASSIGPQFHTAGSTVAGGFGVMPGSPSFNVVKNFGAGESGLKIDFHTTFYANGAAGATFGINVTGPAAFNGNFTMAQIANTNASNLNHTQASGTGRISVGGAGTYTITPIWFRNGGAGTLQVDSGDYFSIAATEVAT